MLALDENAVFQDNLIDTNVFQLYDIITPGEKRKDNINIVDMKQNYKEEFDRPTFIQKVIKPKST